MAPALAPALTADPASSSSEAPAYKRRRVVEEEEEPMYKYDDEDDDEYEQKRYVPLKQRKAAELQKIARLRAGGVGAAAGSASPQDGAQSPKRRAQGRRRGRRGSGQQRREAEHPDAAQRGERAARKRGQGAKVRGTEAEGGRSKDPRGACSEEEAGQRPGARKGHQLLGAAQDVLDSAKIREAADRRREYDFAREEPHHLRRRGHPSAHRQLQSESSPLSRHKLV